MLFDFIKLVKSNFLLTTKNQIEVDKKTENFKPHQVEKVQLAI